MKALILTHRLGGAVLIDNEEKVALPLSSELLAFAKEIAALCGLGSLSPEQEDHLTRVENQKISLQFCTGKTAETLLPAFQGALGKLPVSSLQKLYVGEGPGSFTGLRLGTAFANGLKLSHSSLKLFMVPTISPGVIFQCAKNANLKSADEEFFLEDETQSPVDLLDVYASIVCMGVAKEVPEALPFYGRDPTPVIKLREKGI